jgi:hypothetical protein
MKRKAITATIFKSDTIPNNAQFKKKNKNKLTIYLVLGLRFS